MPGVMPPGNLSGLMYPPGSQTRRRAFDAAPKENLHAWTTGLPVDAEPASAWDEKLISLSKSPL
jgi:hypothetical protein